jgi:CheY-like chemotaxis protein
MQKILVIDDDSLVRDTLLRILERKGYRVLLASDGRHGVQMFRRE